MDKNNLFSKKITSVDLEATPRPVHPRHNPPVGPEAIWKPSPAIRAVSRHVVSGFRARF